VAVGTPADAAGCSTAAGVTVVVDFASLGGGVVVTCYQGDPPSGLAALQSGFDVTPTVRWGFAFVCRINGKPAADPCFDTPPANASWSYWHAQPGGSWSFSSVGASSYNPAPGTVEGWAFGSGSQPSIAPPALPPPPPPPPTQPVQSATQTRTPGPADATTPPQTSAGQVPPEPSQTASVTPIAVLTASPSRDPSAAGDPPGRFPVGAVAGGALVVALATAAGVIAWRRRRPG
jgi:hypothetical protein